MPEHEGRLECRFLEALIAEAQAALARQAAVRAGLWAAAAISAALVGLLAVDAATDFAAGARAFVYGLAAAGGAATVAAAAMLARAGVLAPMGVAHLIERARPDLKNALITFMELRADPAADPSIRAAVGRRAARTLAGADLSGLLSPTCVCRAAWAATAGACLLGATLWLTQGVLFGRGPAAAEAGLMTGGVTLREPDAEASGDTRRSPAAPAAGSTAAAAGPRAAAGATAETLAAALAADKDKFDRLAEALAEKPGGSGQGADGGTSGQSPGKGGAASGANGRAPSVSSESRTNEEKGTSAGENPATAESSPHPSAISGQALAVGTQNASEAGQDAGDGKTGRGAGEQGPSAGANGRAPSVSSGSRTGQEKGTSPGESLATGESTPDLTVGARTVGPRNGDAPSTGARTGDTQVPGARRNHTPPLPKRPQSDAFPEKTLDAMRKVRRLIEEADARLREGEVTDAFLGRMGMSNAEFRRFVAAWQRRIETAAPNPSAIPVAPGQAGGAAPKVEFIPAGAGTDARPVGGLAPAPGAIRGGAVQGADAGVSVRLRPAVSAYFEAVGKLAAEKAGEKATP